MPLREDILNPIPGDKPGGVSLRYDPLYAKIEEARREDDALSQGAWQHERKSADYAQVVKLAQEAIATKSKDLQLVSRLTEALLRTQGFPGLLEGLDLCRSLLDGFWDGLYPEIEDGDLELRAAPLVWISARLGDVAKQVPLTRAGYDWFRYTESRAVGYENQVTGDQAKKARQKLLKEGKLAPEEFDKSFVETPKAFYLQSEKNLDACLASVKALDAICREKFGEEAAPSFSKFTEALETVRHTVHGLLQEKRKTEPDPVEETPPAAAEEAGARPAGEGAREMGTRPAVGLIIPPAATEPADRREAIAAVAAAAALLRKREPRSPAPYLMLRGLRWGELRAAVEANEPGLLEAPPTEVRRHIKTLALENKWAELVEAAENVMSLPCSRAWLDMQRFVVEACAALGSEYDPIAKAIRSELRALLRDVPQLPQLTLLDDTPAANAETQAWLRELSEEPAAVEAASQAAAGPVANGEPQAGWKRRFVDSYQLAQEALRKGDAAKAFELLQLEIDRQRSGRGRFFRKLQMVELCISTGKEAIAQPILDDLAAALEAHKLEDWEDRETVAGALLAIMKASKKIQADAKEKQKLFERICRLNPARALDC